MSVNKEEIPKTNATKKTTISLEKLDLDPEEEEVLRRCADICKLALDPGNRREIKDRILQLFEFFMDNTEESEKEEAMEDFIEDMGGQESKKRKI